MALDNHWALKYFLKYFPEYAKNEFYITGESYGGVYIPTLAARIMDDKTFNFKVSNQVFMGGFAVPMLAGRIMDTMFYFNKRYGALQRDLRDFHYMFHTYIL